MRTAVNAYRKRVPTRAASMKLRSVRKLVPTAALQLALAVSIVLLSAFPMPSHATQEPDYKLVRTYDRFEIREYPAYTVAEVLMPGPAADAGNQGFRILAAYIFGKNRGDRKLGMTAPVTQAPAPVKLDMTAPVTQAPADGGFVVQFILPSGVTADSAPVPLDDRIRVREVPASRVAVIRYSGFWSESNYQEHLASLRSALEAANLITTGEPVYARYNPPFTPWFLRRNEIWLRLADRP